MSADGLAREVRRLVERVYDWTPSRWAASSVSGPATRADAVYALVQELADRAADAEGQARRIVPRLDHDNALSDQLQVVTADLLATAADRPELLEAAATLVADAGRTL